MLKKYLLNLYNNINLYSLNINDLSVDYYNDKIINMSGGAPGFDEVLKKFQETLQQYKTQPSSPNDAVKEQLKRYIFFMNLYDKQVNTLSQEFKEVSQQITNLNNKAEFVQTQDMTKLINDINILFNELLGK
jgi:hypothetical protein